MPKDETIDTPELASQELKAFLQGVYPDYEIKVEEDEEGNYVYTANGVELATVAKDDVVDVYTNLSGSTVGGLTKENDVNKMNTPSTGKRKNYGAKNVINIDVELFNGILSNITNGEALLGTVNSLDTSCLTGDLYTYLASKFSVLGDINSLLAGEKTSASELSFKVDASIKAYQGIDEDLKFGLNTVFANIFSMTSEDIATYNMSIEERETYIDGLIETYTEILTDFKEDYQDLMGCGGDLDLDPESMYIWYGMCDFFTTEMGHYFGGLGANELWDINSGVVDLNRLQALHGIWTTTGLKDKMKAYIVDGKSWEEAGLNYLEENNPTRCESNFLNKITNSFMEDDFWPYCRENDMDYTDFYHKLDEDNPDYELYRLKIKEYIGSKDVFNLEDQYKDVLAEKNRLEADIYTLENTVYNYKQYRGLLPYEEYSKDPQFTLYLAGDMSFALTDPNLKNGELYNYMDASEVALYKLILDTKGESEAKSYLNALTDTINQRKGFEVASKFCQIMNQNGDDVLDLIYSGLVGFGDGNQSFFDGLGNFFGGADGIRSPRDYENMYKVLLLSSENEYTSNLSPVYKELIKFQYQACSSLGQNTIPMILNFVPIPGARTLSSSLMFASSAGNSIEGALQDGYSRGQAYLYGTLSGASEVLLEKLLGHLPGIGKSSAAMGTETLLQSMFGEAKEEMIQTYLDGAFRSTILGEPFDLTNLTGEALQAGLTAMYCAAASNIGAKKLIKIGDKIINVATNGNQTSYVDWCNDIRSHLTEEMIDKLPDSAQRLFKVGIYSGTLRNGIDIDPSSIAGSNETNMGTGGASTIDGIQFDPKSNSYLIRFKNGKTMITTDLTQVTTLDCLTQTFGVDENFANMADTWFNGGCDDAVVSRLVQNGEVLGYDNVGQLMNLLSDPNILSLYEDARANPLKDLETFRTHGIGHITDVLDATIDAYVNLKSTNGAKHVNPMTMALAAIMHDTGMSGGQSLHAYLDEGGLIKIDPDLTLLGDTGDVTRGNHSFNSGLDTLMMRDTILEYFPGADVDMAAIMAFAHSKSNSGVTNLSTPEGWTVAIQALDAGIQANNRNGGNFVFTNPDGSTTGSFIEHLKARGLITGVSSTPSDASIKYAMFDENGVPIKNKFGVGKGEVVTGKVYAFEFAPHVMEQLGESGYLLRIGDSNTTNHGFGYNQFGESIVVPTNTNGNLLDGNAPTNVAALDASAARESAGIEFLVGGEGKTSGAQFVIGESNMSFGTDTLTLTEENGASRSVFVEEFTVRDGDYFPYSTLTQFNERMGEMSSAGSGISKGQSVVIRLPSNTGDYALDVYRSFVEQDLKPNIDGMYLYVGDELVYSKWR